MITSCICPGQEAVFRCTVDGGVATVWRGSALENCTDGSIILRHSQFRDVYIINESCGTSGFIIGKAISAENGSYTSHLTVFANQELNGSIIVCATDGELLGSRIQILTTTGA